MARDPRALPRATCVLPTGQALTAPRIYVSGTSSIVDHEAVHRGDIESQCHTALENIRRLICADNTARYGLARGYELTDLDQIKVYVRHAEHMGRVRNICGKAFSPSAEIAYLNVDICRSDLLVEIEGVAR
jgi:chorismate lyase / 3-hydroxybenzoate synthase